MFTLIKREIEDHAVNFLAAVVISATMIGLLVYFAYTEFEAAIELLMPLGVLALLACCFMGITQTYTDRANKISPFLATLAVTRGQILTARCIVGLLAILTLLVPAAVGAVVLLSKFLPPIAFYWRAIVEVFATVFLGALACYCLGLLIGSTTRKLILAAGCLAVPPAVIVLVLAKGFGCQVMIVLGLVILASIGRIVTKLSSTPL
jgi:hypothetical protein